MYWKTQSLFAILSAFLFISVQNEHHVDAKQDRPLHQGDENKDISELNGP